MSNNSSIDNFTKNYNHVNEEVETIGLYLKRISASFKMRHSICSVDINPISPINQKYLP